MSIGPSNTAFRIDNGNSKLINEYSGAHTLDSDDNGCLVVIDSATDVDVTVPTLLPPGFNCIIFQKGAGIVTAVVSGTTINNLGTTNATAGQWGTMKLWSISPDVFVIDVGGTGTAPESGGGGTGVDAITSLAHTYKVSLMTPVADGTAVSTLPDTKGTADFTSTGSQRPVYRTGGGTPYLEWDGTDDVMTGTLAALTDFSLVLVVAEPVDSVDYSRFIDAGNFALFGVTGAIPRHLFASLGGTGADWTSYPAASSSFMAMYVEVSGTAVKLRVNGTEILGTLTTTGTGTTWRLGSLDGASYFRHMNVKELRIFSDNLSAPDFTTLATYVLGEYGLTL